MKEFYFETIIIFATKWHTVHSWNAVQVNTWQSLGCWWGGSSCRLSYGSSGYGRGRFSRGAFITDHVLYTVGGGLSLSSCDGPPEVVASDRRR